MSESEYKWINIENIDDNIINMFTDYDKEIVCGVPFKYVLNEVETFRDDLDENGEDYGEDYGIQFRKFPHQLPTDAHLEIYKRTFVNNIIQATNITHGYNDLSPWKALFMCHTDDKTDIFYVWFEASCSYTGFSAYGEMIVWMSTDLDIITNVVKSSVDSKRTFKMD
jgi:hypothetical protein